ncbi:MAG: hypothetical protein KJ558_01525 [Gammaproteobacteria bacterium]|nr:hypothetical protein [Gammaproteobacteria bacterium]MBU1653517.1 hypothetical protein [Gammaproteobacteria bacterium]MBU1961865.1 hypothetical protein [Gammaproteobacteria bacterium]
MSDYENMSSEELFELAKKRKEEEAVRKLAEAKAKIDELRAKRREIASHYNKELGAVDAEIKKLGGRSRKATAAGGAASRTPGVSAKIVEIVTSKGQASTKEIAAELVTAGIEPKNLSQTMAYLKRKGGLISVGHGTYAPPPGG